MLRPIIDEHVKKVFVEVNCAQNADKFFLSTVGNRKDGSSSAFD
jgi:hypothetical protein